MRSSLPSHTPQEATPRTPLVFEEDESNVQGL